jgi:RNA polymerase sigma-70 factor (ECF subfamily)
MSVPPSTDDDLLAQVRAGDEKSFVALYRRYATKLYRFVLQMSGSASTAEDVTQEVFLALMRGGFRYDSARGSLQSFLYGVARNHVLRRLERERWYLPLPDQQDGAQASGLEPLAVDQDVVGGLTRNARIENVRRAVLTLPRHYREVLVLCDLHEVSYADAAAILRYPVGTVRSRLHRARALLLRKLRPNDDPAAVTDRQARARCLA